MKLLVRCLVLSLIVFSVPALAQYPGGLPGKEHLAAGVAFKDAGHAVLPGDVAHYWFDLTVGPGAFDTIRLHRVVREGRIGRPAKMEGVLLLPGSPQLFESIFLPPAAPGVPPAEGSIALFLATHGLDVWGMDYGWTRVPYGTTDLAELEGWDTNKEVAHVTTALSVARWLRVRSGQGVDPINLLGFSYGGFLAYAVAAEDSQRPGNLKNVKGLVAVEGGAFKNINTAAACASAANLAAQLAAGAVVSDSSSIMLAGRAALNDPEGLATLGLAALPPYFLAVPPLTFTNYQYAVASFIRNGYFGGTYAPNPASATAFFTDPDRLVTLLAETPAYQLVRLLYEGSASRCNSGDYPVSFDDHLGEVTIPILSISRRNVPTNDVLSFILSTDVTTVLLNPTSSPSLYGHADVVMANDAASAVWETILEWIRARPTVRRWR
jgi:pimeloyl-ACP methyl ester carboxylesterase